MCCQKSDCTLGSPVKVFPPRRSSNAEEPLKATKRPSLDFASGHVHAEWERGHSGFHGMEVEVREEVSSTDQNAAPSTTLLVNNTPVYTVSDGPVVIVRVEEVLLVVLVLVIWVAAIALFFNRWGKIRMLEPYQPKFHQQPHRPSCPLAPLSPPGLGTQQRMSFSKYNVNALTDPLSVLPSPIIRRPRQNSVFVGSSTMAVLNPPPRRVKSAMDIQHLVVSERSPSSLSGSIIPILNRERRPSLITIERPIDRPLFISRRRPSINVERPLLSSYQPPIKGRRLSCFLDRPIYRHRNFISFELPERRTPLASSVPQRSSSYQQPTISLETPLESCETSENALSAPRYTELVSNPKISRSFEQPVKEKIKPARMATSLEVSDSFSLDRRVSIVEEDRSSPVYITLDETKITAPLLEGLKSSDV